VTTAILAYDPVPEEESAESVWLETPGTHRVCAGYVPELLAAMNDLRPRAGAKMVVLGSECGKLGERERLGLLARIGFVPANGGLISSLNCWENISLPVAYHEPARLSTLLEEVQDLLEALGGVDDNNLLAKMPEQMSLYERRLTGFIRELIERPDLMVVENLAGGLTPTKRKRAARFVAIYHAYCPGGTFVHLEEKPEE
jgi:ABC-type transporter Mla maintaining outer membrane lipid asymmetry ATPase subunit MlaF